jgi:ADP-ribosylglycohydrolase
VGRGSPPQLVRGRDLTATAQYDDRDTLGAIVGGVVVLATGEAGIPALWRAAVEDVPDPLAAELPALAD